MTDSTLPPIVVGRLFMGSQVRSGLNPWVEIIQQEEGAGRFQE